jgi:hypothetical protein
MKLTVVGWLVSLLVVALALRPRRVADVGDAPPARPWRGALVVFALAVATRLLLRRQFGGDWFFADEHLDACILPVEFRQGEPMWAGGTSYPVYLATLVLYHVFGFGPSVARLGSVLAFSTGAALLHVAAGRVVGARAARRATALLLCIAPFLTHGVYATAIAWALAPVALLLLLLSTPTIGPLAALAVGPLLAGALFAYPGACIAGIALVAAHAACWPDRWLPASRATGLVGLAVGVALALGLRAWLGGQLVVAQWGHGAFAPGQALGALGVLLRDLFWKARTWNTVTPGAPWVEPVLVGFVLLALAGTGRLADERRRWAWTLALAAVGTILLATLGGPQPGARRAIGALPFVALLAGRGMLEASRRAPAALGSVAMLLAVAIVVDRGVHVVGKWPQRTMPDFVAGARAALASEELADHAVVVLAEPADPYGGEEWRCAIALDERLGPHLGHVRAIRRFNLSDAPDVPRRKSVLLASVPLDEDALRQLFGRTPSRTRFRGDDGPPDATRLRALYLFPRK